MIPGVRTQVLADYIEGRARPAAIAQHTLGQVAEVPPCVNRQDVVRNILPDIGDDKRDSINEGEFPKTILIRAT
jgi:hypothetical protein